MRNYFGGLHQFPTNIAGEYRFAVVGDVVLSGLNSYLVELGRFLGTASLRGITEILYLGPALSLPEAESWPRTPGMTTWCLNPLPTVPGNGNGDLDHNDDPNGNHRDDLRAAPPGFAIIRPGYTIPVFLHHYSHLPTTIASLGNRYQADAAVHLVAGLPIPGDNELPDGGYEISIGTFPFAAAIVELQLDDSGGLECSVDYLQLDNLPSRAWP